MRTCIHNTQYAAWAELFEPHMISDHRKEETAMDLQEVIRELQNIKNYCTPSALPALEYAITVLTGKLEDQANNKDKTGER